MSQIESLSQIEGKLNNLSLLANENIKNAKSDSELDQLRVSLLGKKGELSIILKTMGKLSSVDRPIIGQKANLIKINLQDLITKRKNQLISEAIEKGAIAFFGDKYGESVSINILSRGIFFTVSLNSSAFLKVIIPEKDI